MLERKITSYLQEWKNRREKMCLLVKGARQVGKTFIIDRFAKDNYPNYIRINFDENPDYCTIFNGDLDVNSLIKKITISIPGTEMIPHKTLLFLDEIQNCPNARTALKFFSMDKRYDVIATGSMLGINYKDVPSYPVGYVEYFEMYSLDFEEFLWANGLSKSSIEDLRYYFYNTKPVPEAIHQRMLELFKEYIIIGGMPQVVSTFVETKNYTLALNIQKGIITGYMDDIAKYAEKSEKVKARACFLSIPKHLSKDYKKFRYSLVEKGGSNRKFGGSLTWLYDAGIISFCHNLSVPNLPFEGYANSNIFKVYMKDTGLLISMLDEGTAADIINGSLGIYKGAVYENIIADVFTKNGKKLYYFEHNSQIEIDFFIRFNDGPAAVEVKSGNNTKSKSLLSIMDNYNVKTGIRLSTKNIGTSNNVLTLPIYMAMFL